MTVAARRVLAWRRITVVAFVVNAILLVWLVTWNAWGASDWALFTLVDPAAPYVQVIIPPDIPNLWRYSPVALWILQPVAIFGGQAGFVLLHFALLALLPRRAALIVAISFPFWVDVVFGNVFTLVFVAAFWAVRRNRIGIVAFAVMTLLMPRPVQLPLLAWLLWRESWFRLPFFVLFDIHLLIVVWSGQAQSWWGRLLTNPTDIGAWFNAGPSQVLGYSWLIVGLPLGIWLLWRGRPLWAGLAMAPYLLPQYWMLVIGEDLEQRASDLPPRGHLDTYRPGTWLPILKAPMSIDAAPSLTDAPVE